MKRATTPLHEFSLPIYSSLVKKYLLPYAQDNKIVLEKGLDDMTVESHVWSAELTQEESNLFHEGYAYAQIRYLMPDGTVSASTPLKFHVDKVPSRPMCRVLKTVMHKAPQRGMPPATKKTLTKDMPSDLCRLPQMDSLWRTVFFSVR